MSGLNFAGVCVSFVSGLLSTGLSKPLAYLDPGTGSYIVQLLLAGLMGGLFLVKVYWKKIKGFFASLFSKGDPESEPEVEADAE